MTNLSEETIRNLIKDRYLPSVNFGRNLYCTTEMIEWFVQTTNKEAIKNIKIK